MKKYTLLTYKNSNIYNAFNFDSIEEVTQLNEFDNIYKIKLFELNGKDGRNLLNEYIINDIVLDDTFTHPDTKILGYEIYKHFTGTIKFRIKYEMTKEVQQANELWHKTRFIDLRLIQSKQDESLVDIVSGGLHL